MVSEADIVNRLAGAFPGAELAVRDLTGGGDHWQVTITAGEFSEKTLLEQHQMVYRALGDWMKRDIHALALKTIPR
jgi:stress-induced morphogen